MPDTLPACFGGIAGGPPASTAAGPSLVTSVYETLLGVASLTWSRTVLGLLVRVVLRIDDDDEEDSETLTFKIRPWLLWKRRGSRRLRVKDRHVDLSWDLSRAKFPATGGPEPSSGYSISVSVDGEPVLLAGDLKSKTAAARSSPLISRREHVAMAEERSYSTSARLGGRERSVAIELDNGEMLVEVEGKQVLQVRRLRWKFRGSERVNLGGGDRVQISWDLHDWLFPSKKDTTATAPSEKQQQRSSAPSSDAAMFVFRFESEEEEEEEVGHFGKEWFFGKNWSETSSSNSNNGGGGGGEKRGNSSKNKKKKRLGKTCSSSSSTTSSASSSASSTVMEWASHEETVLRGRRGDFSLVVYASKS